MAAAASAASAAAAASIDNKHVPGETFRARARSPPVTRRPSGTMKTTAAVNDSTVEDATAAVNGSTVKEANAAIEGSTVEDATAAIEGSTVEDATAAAVAAVEGTAGDVAVAAVEACTLVGDFSLPAELNNALPLLAACACMPTAADLSLHAINELLSAWEKVRGSIITSWRAGISRFQRLLLFSPRGTAGTSPCPHCSASKAKAAAVSNLSIDTSVTSREDREASGVLQQPDTILAGTPSSPEVSTCYASADPDEAEYSYSSRQNGPDGLDMLGAFEGLLLLWQHKRETTQLMQTAPPQPSREHQQQQRQLQKQLKDAVSRGLLLRHADRTSKTLLDWEEPYAPRRQSDTIVCHTQRDKGTAAQATSVTPLASAQTAAQAPSVALSAAPRLRTTTLRGDPIALSEAAVGRSALQRRTVGARDAAANDLKRRVDLAMSGEMPLTDPSTTVANTEVYRPSLAAAAAALEVNIARSCEEATADVLLYGSSLPLARENAERCSRVFCILEQVDGSLVMMQQQQVDCLHRIYGRIQQVVTNFLNKIVKVASLQTSDIHSCETLYCVEGDIASCNNSLVSLAKSSPVPEKNLKTAKQQRQRSAPGGATLVLPDKNVVCPASDSAAKADNAATTTADTGTTAHVLSRFQVLLGLHVITEALLQKLYCEDAFHVSASENSDPREAAAVGWAATAAGREMKAVEASDGVPAATTDRRQARSVGYVAPSRRNENSFPLSKATDSHQNDGTENSEPNRPSRVHLRRAAVQRIHAVTAEILQSCGKLLHQLQYVDQAIVEALTSHPDSDYSSEDRNGTFITAGDTPEQGTALSPFLEPLQLPSAAAALRATKVLQEAIRKTP